MQQRFYFNKGFSIFMAMIIKELESKDEMLECLRILNEVYPSLTKEDYSTELDLMLKNDYGQVGVFENDLCIGLTGYWIGTKLWCGRYMELDNVVISENHRGQGVGELLFEHMEQKAKECNCNMLALDSYTDNFKAHKFFYKQNYKPRGFHFINILNQKGVR